uniref:Uncharacterized protein n=1 Tax=Solanum lycopersicum TaxID=4081 RepID=A0A3Q7EC17_SOLLC
MPFTRLDSVVVSVQADAVHNAAEAEDANNTSSTTAFLAAADLTRTTDASNYTEELLTRAGMSESKTAPTPMVVRPPSTSDSRLFDNPTCYQNNVCGLNYLAVTRPDIQYAVNRSSRRGLLFQKGNLELSVYSDSDSANDKDDHRSTT